jgi:hypothetical protein
MDHSKELSIAGALSVLTICYFQQRELTKLRTDIKTKQTIIDSLNSEILVKDIDLGRYEVMWNKITEIHPKSVEQVEHEVE